jgi:integrase
MPVEIEPEHAKTEQPYMSELRPRTVKLLTEFRGVWRPLLGNQGTPYPFPEEGLNDPARQQAAVRRVASRVARLVRRRLDVDFCLQDLRRLLATIYAEANPGDERTAQLKLGHESPETTHRYYIDPQQLSAVRRFDAAIDKLIGGGTTRLIPPESEAYHDVY